MVSFDGIFCKKELMKTQCASYGTKDIFFQQIPYKFNCEMLVFGAPYMAMIHFATSVKHSITGSYLHFPVTLKPAAKLVSFYFKSLYEGFKQDKAIVLFSLYGECNRGHTKGCLPFHILGLL